MSPHGKQEFGSSTLGGGNCRLDGGFGVPRPEVIACEPDRRERPRERRLQAAPSHLREREPFLPALDHDLLDDATGRGQHDMQVCKKETPDVLVVERVEPSFPAGAPCDQFALVAVSIVSISLFAVN